MKQGWEIKKLGEVCEVLDSQRKPVTKKDRKEGSYPYYGATGIQDYVDSYIFDGRYLLVGEDGAKWGSNDKTAFVVDGKCWVNNHAHILKLYDNVIDSFAEYYLVYKDLNEYITGAIVQKLTQKALVSIPIPIPPLPEQKKIVSELDCLSGIIEKKRQQLKELDALAQSIFYEMFGNPVDNERGWEVKKLKNVFSVKIGPFGSLLHNSDYVSGGIPLVNPIHMQNETICPDKDFTVSEEMIKELQNYRLFAGDVIFARRGDIGRCALVRERDNGFLCGTGSLFVRPVQPVDSFFFVKMMRCESMIEHLASFAKGATMLNINCKIIEDLDIILPPLPLQQTFASKIEAIEKQKALIKQSLGEVETLFNARMQEYFD